VNEVFLSLGIASWKPVLSTLLLPPVPLLLLTLLGLRLAFWRRSVGWLLVLLSVLGLWFGATSVVGEALQRHLLGPAEPLVGERLAQLKREAVRTPMAIVVLGSGRESLAPEYGVASLPPMALERLRYGVWLSRETGAPILFSGGTGHASQPGASEAEVAAGIAAREFLRPLRWTETQSRDTRENALLATAALRDQGIGKLVLVTHGWHMPRSLRAFRQAAAREGAAWEVVPAPMGLAPRVERPALRWMPSGEGFMLVRVVLREKIGLLLGA
jgi:uncharacterized SAM-binding protein YcdF (DUF218 family)